jgi:hypothetical protein
MWTKCKTYWYEVINLQGWKSQSRVMHFMHYAWGIASKMATSNWSKGQQLIQCSIFQFRKKQTLEMTFEIFKPWWYTCYSIFLKRLPGVGSEPGSSRFSFIFSFFTTLPLSHSGATSFFRKPSCRMPNFRPSLYRITKVWMFKSSNEQKFDTS